jgi:predicted nucleic acid-binding protein
VIEGPRRLILPAPASPEVDYLLGHRRRQESATLSAIMTAYLVADLPSEGYARVAALNRQFADLGLGFVDAAIVALAETLGLRRIATADRRHFGPVASALKLELLP